MSCLGVTCQMPRFACHLSHVTNANSNSHGPSPANSLTMHSRMGQLWAVVFKTNFFKPNPFPRAVLSPLLFKNCKIWDHIDFIIFFLMMNLFLNDHFAQGLLYLVKRQPSKTNACKTNFFQKNWFNFQSSNAILIFVEI